MCKDAGYVIVFVHASVSSGSASDVDENENR